MAAITWQGQGYHRVRLSTDLREAG